MNFAKKALCAMAISAACAGSAHAAQVGWTLTIDDTTNTLTSSLAGVTITTLGAQHWQIDASGLLAAVTGGGSNMTWLNDAGDPGENWFHRTSGLLFELNGDWTGATPGLFANCGTSPNPLAQGITCLTGIGLINVSGGRDTYFVTVIERPSAAVPEPVTLALVGAALAGLALTRRRKG